MEVQTTKSTPTLLILIIGIVIGLLIAGAFFLVKSRFINEDEAGVTTETQGLLLSISKPADGDNTSSSELSITGSAGKDAIVVVTGGVDDVIVETKSSNFTAKVKLLEGENELTVYAFDPETGASTQDTLNILYLKEELGSRSILVAEASTEVIEKNKVKIEKLKDRLSTKSSELKKAISTFKRSHVFGTITSIKDTTLTIETKQGSIKTVYTDDFTKFFSVNSKGRSPITLEDLKVGDKVSVAGIGKNDPGGDAKHIVVLKRSIPKRHAVMGKVKELDGTLITLTHITKTDRLYSVIVGKDAKIKIKGQEEATLTDIKVGGTLIASGSVDKNGKIIAKRVFVIPAKATPEESTKSATPSSTQ